MRWHLFLFVLFAVVREQSDAASFPGCQFLSASGEYAVELSVTPENELLVTVFKISKEGKILGWSRPVDWKEPFPGWNSPGVQGIKALVTNDGNTVVLRDESTPEVQNDVRILGRSEPEDHTVRAFENREVTAVKQGMRWGVSYLHVGAVMDFILDKQKSYAIWFGQTDQWLLISLETFKTKIIRDPNMLSQLNELGHRKAEELVLEHQPPMLRKMIAALKEQVARVAPSLGASGGPRSMTTETAAAYLFLTTRRKAADRHYIDGLVEYRPDGIQRAHWMGNGNLEIPYFVSMSERLVGDFLRSRWNGETNREFLPRETYLLIPQDTFRFLGSIKVNFQLPIPLPRTNSGIMWAYLIPAGDRIGKWEQLSDLITFASFLQYRSRESAALVGPGGEAIFRALSPGEYRIKLIWERHPAAMGFWRTNIYTAMPGDYESPVTEPITVKAGEMSERVVLACTNRVGAKEAYAADEAWANETGSSSGQRQTD